MHSSERKENTKFMLEKGKKEKNSIMNSLINLISVQMWPNRLPSGKNDRSLEAKYSAGV